MKMLRFYRYPALTDSKKRGLVNSISELLGLKVSSVDAELCFNIEGLQNPDQRAIETLKWLLRETFEPDGLSEHPFLTGQVIEVGPRLNFATPWCSNALSIFKACGVDFVDRIEQTRRYRVSVNKQLTETELRLIASQLHDPMTECVYSRPIETFQVPAKPQPVRTIPLIERGKEALIALNVEMGLGFDEWDLDYYYNLFVRELRRNPTDVELFDLSQSNSEHSRHWFFKGQLVINGTKIPETLFQIVKEPYIKNPNNSLIAFKDNSSAIRGYRINTLIPKKPDAASAFELTSPYYHLIFTAETHNFPTGVSPFEGAETGTGGRIRDVHATGRGSLVVAGTAGYCVGNLFIPHYPLPWEHGSLIYPQNLASPLKILIEASNGASDYGNKFGEPVIQGFCRSFGLRLHNGERWEWIKPIMFTGGIGQIDNRHIQKGRPQKGMFVVKIGGPAYRIGIGGGSASSMISGDNPQDLDFNAVQRGDAEMEQRLNRVIRACVEMGDDNPIISIHDQGAGGNCNVIKEIVYPEGARIDINKIILGDKTLSYLEIWGAEYQEQDALLIHPDRLDDFLTLCKREKTPVAVIGEISGDGRLVLYSSKDGQVIEDLPLEKALADMPQKTFHLTEYPAFAEPYSIPDSIGLREALERVLRHVSVCSKRFLTTKVDRSVTGLIAQQQCVGPLQLPLCDFAMISQSHFQRDGRFTGAAIAIGEQPIKSIINPSAMARLAVTEALTNIVWAGITALEDIKCSANWMWAPKLEGEGFRLYRAAKAMSDFMLDLGIAVDGGKDSLSMAAKVIGPGSSVEIVKSPPTLVISAYAPCEDVTIKATPDIKAPGRSALIFIDLSQGQCRLGGSALLHSLKWVGHDCPDLDDPHHLKRAFQAVQLLLKERLILAGHDRSDGGLIVTLLEMAFAGNCGLEVQIPEQYAKGDRLLAYLFAEEPGLVFEYLKENELHVTALLDRFNINYTIIGSTLEDLDIHFYDNHDLLFRDDIRSLRAAWEETSSKLDALQANPDCVAQESKEIYDRKGLSFNINFSFNRSPEVIIKTQARPAVAIIREEGSNGDREMASAFYYAGFEPWDVNMQDLADQRIDLESFKGIAFVGGFSYADVLGSAKGWAGTIRFNSTLKRQFDAFYDRSDTFSLGVCNGCQLMALLGWVPWLGLTDTEQPRFIQNQSGRFESRFLAVKILPSPSIMLKGMEGSVLGIWVAHGEGKIHFPSDRILDKVIEKDLAPIRYVDDEHQETERYPYNPNGSPFGIAGLCSVDGRHLAMMPHPERSFLWWQWPVEVENIDKGSYLSPWIRLFENAKSWLDNVV